MNTPKIRSRSVLSQADSAAYRLAQESVNVRPNGPMPVAGAYKPIGYQMIRTVSVRNFRCFERQDIDDCKRVNVIVGDNGTGKTSLLESIFLPLAATTELLMRYRNLRGIDNPFGFRGSARKIADSLASEWFYNFDQNRTVSVALEGDFDETRSVFITRGAAPESSLPFDEDSKKELVTSGAINFTWIDYEGKEYNVKPNISAQGIQFPETGEDNPNFFFFSAINAYGASDSAERFSELSRSNRLHDFIVLIRKEYPWIRDLSLETIAGNTSIYATLRNLDEKVSLGNVSGGINRIVSVLLAIASRPRSIMLIDELENGLYYKHHKSIWGILLLFAREYDSQLFITSHSEEWIEALVKAAGRKVADISLWRVERNKRDRPEIFQFDGNTLKAGIEFGKEIRGI